MMDPNEILTKCKHKGVRLSLRDSDSNISAKGPRGSITRRMTEGMKNHKAELMPVILVMEVFDGEYIGVEEKGQQHEHAATSRSSSRDVGEGLNRTEHSVSRCRLPDVSSGNNG